MATMQTRPASASLDLGLSQPTDLGGGLVGETEEQKRKRMQSQQSQMQNGAMSIISPAVQSLLGVGV